MRLTVGEHSPQYVRRIVRSYLREWEMAELTDAVELGATELLANVVRHVPDRRCEFLLLRQVAGVRVEVMDGCPRLPSIPAELPLEAEGGRGLVLLDAVADKWGVEPAAVGGKTVWFECWGEVEGEGERGAASAGVGVDSRTALTPSPKR
ncbi:ATP-binding protein [Streptomyces phaeochromogenes]|uniref:ATP-binding protein n=1 Tax=Streptomyces phaeochromogenes TaxID=1923 RepID=UPI003866202A|nr:ATP-binding protein [Streptomyces phaeochromogenes]WSW21293.1 ATP-binding protein [Streptomyces phaeochromogenes]